MRTIISLIRPQALETDLREVLRELLKDPKAAVDFRRYLATFLRSYVALDTGTLEFGPNSAEVNRVVACLKGLPFEDWRSPALVWLAQQPSAREALEFLKLLEGLALGLFILGRSKLQIAKRFKEVNKEALMRISLSTRGALHLTDAEVVKLRELLEAPIPARKKFLRHVLLRLNTLSLHPALPPHFPTDATIEHVLPQKPNGRSQWIEIFPDAVERKRLCELMGNYTLLTGKLNTSARNHDFEKKKEIIFALSNVSMFPLTGNLTRYATWTERDIRTRQTDMLRLLRQVLPI